MKKIFIGIAVIIIEVLLIIMVIITNNNTDKLNESKEERSDIIKIPSEDENDEKTNDEKISILPSPINLEWETSNPVKNNIKFPYPDSYSFIEGVTTFRSNNFRNTASYGYTEVKDEKLSIKWRKSIGYINEWTGVGWNGQPVIVKWSEKVKNAMNIKLDKMAKNDLKEVIYPALDGKIYFLDLDDGKETRKPINIGFSMKCTATVDPRGYPILYCGQGINEKTVVTNQKPVNDKDRPTDSVNSTSVTKKITGFIGYRIFSLFDQSVIYSINGIDDFAYRKWGAFDSSGLVCSEEDSIVVYGENGLLYVLKLNTSIDLENKALSVDPEVSKFRYVSPVDGWLGIEGSVAAYKNYSYFADNSGTLICIDLNELKPVWTRNVNDDTDSTIALDIENNNDVSLYTACEVDKQTDEVSYSYIRKINAQTGELLWEKKYHCVHDSYTNGGVLGSPIIGTKDIKDYVIYSIAKVEESNKNKLIAFDKSTGNVEWELDFDFYSWSSPVDIHTEDGKTYIIFCDAGGRMYLIEAKTGKILDKIELGANVEGSPAVYENTAVVGTRGQEIIGIEIN